MAYIIIRMKTRKTVLLAAVALIAAGCIALAACKEEEEEVHDFSEYDSLGFDFSDTITVKFGDEEWKTLQYTSRMEHEEISGFDWIYVDAHVEGANFPAVKMKFFRGEGEHAATMSVTDAGQGFTIPGSLIGDPKCGHAFYYELGEIVATDGTRLADWWPRDINMRILKYVDSTRLATAYITGTMFNYRSWLNHEVTDIDSAEMRSFTITFGDLPVGQ